MVGPVNASRVVRLCGRGTRDSHDYGVYRQGKFASSLSNYTCRLSSGIRKSLPGMRNILSLHYFCCSQPLMLGGTTGSALAAVLPASQATYIIVLSYMLQGMGWFLSLMK